MLLKTENQPLDIDLTKSKKFDGFERYYIDACIRAKRESCITRGQRYSVSKLAFLIWDIIVLSTFLLWLSDIVAYFDNYCLIHCIIECKIVIFHVAILLYVFIFISKGRIFERLKESKHQMNDLSKRKSNYYTDSENYINNNVDELKKKP